MKKTLVGLLVVCLTNGLFAQDTVEKTEPGAISTDRPVQSETAFTVPKNHLQFEMGLNYEQGVDHNFDLLTGPNLLVKYGLTNRLEVRMTNNYVKLETEGLNQEYEGWDAPLFGFKYKIIGADGGKTNLVASLSSKVEAWGAKVLRPSTVNLLGRVTLGQSITDSWSVTGGLEYGYYDGEEDIVFYVLQTGYSFSSGLTAIIEYYGFSSDNELHSALNGALVYLINDKHQVDLSGGGGFAGNFYSHYLSVGYSFRLGL